MEREANPDRRIGHDPMERLKIETILPDAFFGKLGRYVAICGHIEYFVWLIAVNTAGYDLDNKDEVDRILRLRKSTRELVDELTRAADHHAEPVKSRILDVAGKLDADGRDPRNMAIHGTWRWDKERAGYKVLYWRNCGTRTTSDWRPQRDIIPESEIDSTIYYVDGLHRELIEIATVMGILPDVDSEEIDPIG